MVSLPPIFDTAKLAVTVILKQVPNYDHEYYSEDSIKERKLIIENFHTLGKNDNIERLSKTKENTEKYNKYTRTLQGTYKDCVEKIITNISKNSYKMKDSLLSTLNSDSIHLEQSVSWCDEASSSVKFEREKLRPWLCNMACVKMTNLKARLGINFLGKNTRKKLVVLGSGWGNLSMIPEIDIREYDVTIISPAHFFSFTPFLPSICGGSMMYRSCVEPVRNFTFRGGKKVMSYYQASASDIDIKNKQLTCLSKDEKSFKIDYDVLVVGVGASTSTFNTPGAKEYSYYLKDAHDARKIRFKVLDNFERAFLPNTTEEEKMKLLNFTIVGAGPTGTEIAGELSDFIYKDAIKHFPGLREHVKITVIEMMDQPLPMFSEKVSNYTKENMKKINIDLKLQTKVSKITENTITYHSLIDNSIATTPYGLVVWASGLEPVEFVKKLKSKIDIEKNQKNMENPFETPTKQNPWLLVNPQLQVLGTEDIYAIGDCTEIVPPQLHKNESLVTDLYRQSESHPLKASSDFMQSQSKELSVVYPQLGAGKWAFKKNPRLSELTYDEFKTYLKEIDNSYKSPVHSAQFATQQGVYLAMCLNQLKTPETRNKAPAFEENWQGSLAYIGNGQVVADLPGDQSLRGGLPGILLWQIVYIKLQKSIQNAVIVLCDWLRVKVAGRDFLKDQVNP